MRKSERKCVLRKLLYTVIMCKEKICSLGSKMKKKLFLNVLKNIRFATARKLRKQAMNITLYAY